MNISVNKQYAIRNEKNCSFICSRSKLIDERIPKSTLIFQIPPIYGYIISSFQRNDYNSTITQLAKQLNINEITIQNFVNKIIENPTFLEINLEIGKIKFPPYLLIGEKSIAKEDNSKSNIFTSTDFDPFLKYIPHRPSIPFFLNLMITTKCYTNCIYCYADRTRRDDLELDELLKLIDNAHEIGLIELTITGGDVFAYKNWKYVFEKIYNCGYHPFISTKIPLKEEDIIFLKKQGIRQIQFSIDSLIFSELNKITGVNEEYLIDFEKMLFYTEKHDIKMNIRSVLTKYNSNIDSLLFTFNKLNNFTHIESWILTPAYYSTFKEQYMTYKTSENELKNILSFLKSLKSYFPIFYNTIESKLSNYYKKFDTVEDFVKNNKACPANGYGMSILSNGKATVCEMLYYNPYCLIGDIKNDRIENIWNSPKANKLLQLSQEDLLHKEGNPCYTCTSFDNCKSKMLKKTCLVDVVKAYGEDKYDYPDPRCPNAPSFDVNKIMY